MNKLEFYRNLYLYEINRKENIGSKVSIYITLLTVLGGIVVFEIQNLYNNIKVNPIIQLELIFLIIVILGINIYFLYKANYEKTYNYLDNPKELKKSFDDLEKYYQKYYKNYKNKKETVEELVMRKTEEKLIESYIECSEHNARVNDARNEENLKFIHVFVISLVVIGIIGIYTIIVKKPIDINIL